MFPSNNTSNRGIAKATTSSSPELNAKVHSIDPVSNNTRIPPSNPHFFLTDIDPSSSSPSIAPQRRTTPPNNNHHHIHSTSHNRHPHSKFSQRSCHNDISTSLDSSFFELSVPDDDNLIFNDNANDNDLSSSSSSSDCDDPLSSSLNQYFDNYDKDRQTQPTIDASTESILTTDSLSHLPSASISNSTAFARALNRLSQPTPANSTGTIINPSSSLDSLDQFINDTACLKDIKTNKLLTLNNPFSSSASSSSYSNSNSDNADHEPLRPFVSPKFIMPKVSLPSRKPFTSNGLALGKLKILLAGDSRSGKTQLIKSIAKVSKDIVHINDTATPVLDFQSSVFLDFSLDDNGNVTHSHTTTTNSASGSSSKRRAKSENCIKNNINVYDSMRHQGKSEENVVVLWEYLASTRPHLDFSSSSSSSGDDDDDEKEEEDEDEDLSYSSAHKHKSSRRPSVVQSWSITSDVSPLEKNVCFVDTLGYGSFSDSSKCITPIVQYLEEGFKQASKLINPLIEQDVALTILSTTSTLSGTPLVDACLYTITSRLKPIDVEFIWQLSKFTPVIPIIVKSDLLSFKELLKLKLGVLQDFKSAGIHPFLFGMSVDESIEKIQEALRNVSSRNTSVSAATDIMNESMVDLGDSISQLSSSVYSSKLEEDEEDFPDIIFPCAVSTVTDVDTEMGASVLMADKHLDSSSSTETGNNNDYANCLVPSELPALCMYLFSYNGATWLRHAAAKKYVNWCQLNGIKTSVINNDNNLNINNSNNHQLVTNQALTTTTSNSSSSQLPPRVVNLKPLALKSDNLKQNSTIALPKEDEQPLFQDFNVVIDLPDIILESRCRAQADTSTWVKAVTTAQEHQNENRPRDRRKNKGKTVSASHDNSALKKQKPLVVLKTNRKNCQEENLSNNKQPNKSTSTTRKTTSSNTGGVVTNHSSSIINIDPLDIFGGSLKFWDFTVKAIGVAVGIKMMIEIYNSTLSDQLNNETLENGWNSIVGLFSEFTGTADQKDNFKQINKLVPFFASVSSEAVTTDKVLNSESNQFITSCVKLITEPLTKMINSAANFFSSTSSSSTTATTSLVLENSSSDFFGWSCSPNPSPSPNIPMAQGSVLPESIKPQSLLITLCSGQLIQESVITTILTVLGV